MAALEAAGFRLERSQGAAGADSPTPDQIVFRGADETRLDLLIAKTPFEWEALERRKRATVLGSEAWVVSPEDLVVYKLIAFRGRDVDDIEDVIRTQAKRGALIDWEYIDRWVKAWQIQDRWTPLRARLLGPPQGRGLPGP